jgi:phosphatidylglycerol:prolipoprotein diacylglycerol transferase
VEHIELPIFNPNILSIGFLQIRWYSLAYIIPLALSWYVLDFCNKKYELNLYNDKNTFSDDYFFYIVSGIIIGGRLGYVFFYNFSYFLRRPLEIIELWKGGMSFHGGFLGVILSGYFLCRKYKIDFFKMMDVCAITAPVALFFGRIANFINLELYGRISNVPWAMIFPFTDGHPRHPSQLYEAFAEGLLLFTIIYYATRFRKLKIKGLNSALFLTFYGLFRIITECFREPDIQLGFFINYLTMGQALSIPIFGLGCYLLYNISQNR